MHKSKSTYFKPHQTFGRRTPEDILLKKERNKKFSIGVSRKKPTMKKAMRDGQLVSGVVERINNNGAIIDIHGVSGFVHLTKISDRWLKHPSEELKVGEQLTFRVISNHIDQKGRVSIKLSRKDLVARPKKKRKKQPQTHQQRVVGIK